MLFLALIVAAIDCDKYGEPVGPDGVAGVLTVNMERRLKSFCIRCDSLDELEGILRLLRELILVLRTFLSGTTSIVSGCSIVGVDVVFVVRVVSFDCPLKL